MKSNLTEAHGNFVAEIESKKDNLDETSSDLSKIVMRTKSTSSGKGIE